MSTSRKADSDHGIQRRRETLKLRPVDCHRPTNRQVNGGRSHSNKAGSPFPPFFCCVKQHSWNPPTGPIWRSWNGQAVVILIPSRVAVTSYIRWLVFSKFSLFCFVLKCSKFPSVACALHFLLTFGEEEENDCDYHRHDAPLFHHWLSFSR